MFKKTDNNLVFHVSDRTLNNTARFSCFLAASALTVGFFGSGAVGAKSDFSFQLDKNPLTTPVENKVICAKGISRGSYATQGKTQAKIEESTFQVTESVDENGVPVEIINEKEFTPDGTRNWISCTMANVRTKPSVDSEKVSDATYSEEVVRISYGSSWSKIRLEDGTEGYVLSDLLSSTEIMAPTATPTPTPLPTSLPTATPVPVSTPAETTTSSETQETAETTAETTVAAVPEVTETELNITVYAACSLNLRSGPSTDASLVRVLNTGDEITVVAQTSTGWYKTALGNYVKASLCTETKPEVPETTSGGSSSSGSGIADYCLQFVGCSYVYAGASPSGFDCSGFVMYVYANYYGITLPHSADSIYQMGYSVSTDEMQAGDVVCNDHNGDGYIDHVSIYIGDGTVVHASTSTTGVIQTNFSELKDVVSIRRLT